jgi:hypothetical protein
MKWFSSSPHDQNGLDATGVAPTNRHVKIPLIVVVHFRDGQLAHEHIYWDQASVLAQLGLIDATALPVAGVETAEKGAGSDAAVERVDEGLKIDRIYKIYRMAGIEKQFHPVILLLFHPVNHVNPVYSFCC